MRGLNHRGRGGQPSRVQVEWKPAAVRIKVSMNLSVKEILRRLGSGESIEWVCATAGLSARSSMPGRKQEAASRSPNHDGESATRACAAVQIVRNEWGIPHIQADNDADLFFGFGYAMAQDRLWQLDFFRRKGAGRLAEICGPGGQQLDFLLRMVGVPSVSSGTCSPAPSASAASPSRNGPRLGSETQSFLQAFCRRRQRRDRREWAIGCRSSSTCSTIGRSRGRRWIA